MDELVIKKFHDFSALFVDGKYVARVKSQRHYAMAMQLSSEFFQAGLTLETLHADKHPIMVIDVTPHRVSLTIKEKTASEPVNDYHKKTYTQAACDLPASFKATKAALMNLFDDENIHVENRERVAEAMQTLIEFAHTHRARTLAT